jgi:broad specificity phosphatase PhoE
MRIYLITHAHTLQQRTTDARLWQLSTRGIGQAEALAAAPFWGEVAAIVCSGEPKTRLTVAPLLRMRPLPVYSDARFDEVHRSGWSDDYAGNVRAFFAGPEQNPPGWETAAAAQERFLAGIDELIDRHPAETVALVGHGLTLSLYRGWLLGQAHVHFADWQGLGFGAVALADPGARQLLADFTGGEAGRLPT